VINGVGSSIKGIIYARQFDTVEKLFEFIRQELVKRPRRAYLEYDPQDGHPTSVRFNDRELASDTDYGFTITNFTPLFPPLPPPFQPPPGRGPNGSPATATGQKEK
jgi:hypothetical protein